MSPDDLDALIRVGRKSKLFDPAPAHAVNLGRQQIETLLPHRQPFLFLDRVTAVDLSLRAVAGTRHIARTDAVFRGHFPTAPIYPGVLQLEIAGQLGLCLLGLMEQSLPGRLKQPRDVRILKVHHAVFLAEVRPADDLVVLAKVVVSDEYTAICAGQIVRGGTICTFAVMEVYFVDA